MQVTMPANDAKFLLRAISKDETRPTLRRVFAQEIHGRFYWIATDGHRLHAVECAAELTGRQIDGEVFSALTKKLKKRETLVNFPSQTEEQTELKPPSVQQTVPFQQPVRFVVAEAKLARLVSGECELVLDAADEGRIGLHIGDNAVSWTHAVALKAAFSKTKEHEAGTPAAFNPEYVREALHPSIGDGDVTVQLTDECTPIKVTGGDGTWFAVVMPKRVFTK